MKIQTIEKMLSIAAACAAIVSAAIMTKQVVTPAQSIQNVSQGVIQPCVK